MVGEFSKRRGRLIHESVRMGDWCRAEFRPGANQTATGSFNAKRPGPKPGAFGIWSSATAREALAPAAASCEQHAAHSHDQQGWFYWQGFHTALVNLFALLMELLTMFRNPGFQVEEYSTRLIVLDNKEHARKKTLITSVPVSIVIQVFLSRDIARFY